MVFLDQIFPTDILGAKQHIGGVGRASPKVLTSWGVQVPCHGGQDHCAMGVLGINERRYGASVGEVAADLDSVLLNRPLHGRVGVNTIKPTVQHTDHHALALVSQSMHQVQPQLPGLRPSHSITFGTAHVRGFNGPSVPGKCGGWPWILEPRRSADLNHTTQVCYVLKDDGDGRRVSQCCIQLNHNAIEPPAGMQPLDGLAFVGFSNGQHLGNAGRRNGKVGGVECNALTCSSRQSPLGENLQARIGGIQVHPASHLVLESHPVVIGRDLGKGGCGRAEQRRSKKVKPESIHSSVD